MQKINRKEIRSNRGDYGLTPFRHKRPIESGHSIKMVRLKMVPSHCDILLMGPHSSSTGRPVRYPRKRRGPSTLFILNLLLF